MYEVTIEDHKVVASSGAGWELYVDSDLRDTSHACFPELFVRMEWSTILRASIACRDGQKRGIELQMSSGFVANYVRFLFAGNEIKKWDCG